MKKLILVLPVVSLLAGGCTFVACDRVFPKLDWYWSEDARRCRGEVIHPEIRTNAPLTKPVGE